MDLELSGSTAIVVGAAGGIGRAIASAFVAEGAAVALIDRDPEVGLIAEPLRRAGRAAAFVADVAEFEAVQQVADSIVQEFGSCDHVVFAAAVGSGKVGFPFWSLEPGDWDRVLRVNLQGAVNVAHAFAPGMAERGSGSLLFVSSVAGQVGSQTDPPYSASKAALINFAQCAARDLAPSGVRVNALCPGMVETELNRSVHAAWAQRQPAGEQMSFEEWAAEKIRRLVPLGRWQEPEDLAAMAVFLASPRAKNITGQTINVDGGYVMR